MALIRQVRTGTGRLCGLSILTILIICIGTITYRPITIYMNSRSDCEYVCSYSSTFTRDTLPFNASHFIRHFPDFVCPQNFRNLADWIYGWPDQFHEHVEVTRNTTRVAPCLPPGSIIYVRIWAMDEFFAQIYAHLQNNFVLVTGEGDVSSPTHLQILEAPDSKIIHWFGQNGQYDVSKSKKFTHIPIGNFFSYHSLVKLNILIQEKNSYSTNMEVN